MEFTILNQLVNLVMGRLNDNASSLNTGLKSQKPHNTNVITRSTIRTGIKALLTKEWGTRPERTREWTSQHREPMVLICRI
jgi:hypothetical protein